MTSLERLGAIPAHRPALDSEKALLSIAIQRELHSHEKTADYLMELEIRALAINEPKGCTCGKPKTCPRKHPELRVIAPALQLEPKPKKVRETAPVPVGRGTEEVPEIHPRPDDDSEMEVAR